jgi:molecular chaperone DnaK
VLAVGIDLGTTNSVISAVRGGVAEVLADENGDVLTPSIVNFHPSNKIVVGRGARARRRIDASNTVFGTKRMLGHPFDSPEIQAIVPRVPYKIVAGDNATTLVAARGSTYTLPEISAFVLRHLREYASMRTGALIEHAVITVPAHFNELQRAATKIAGKIAGLEVMRVINEPTAAALAYFRDGTAKKRVAVYDFGGGTFDCTILDLGESVYEVLATCGDSFLGGDDIDNEIALRMRDQLLSSTRVDAFSDMQIFDRLRSAAEELKIQLSQRDHAQIQLQELAFGAFGKPVHLDFGLNRRDFNALANGFVDRTLLKTQEALALAGVSVTEIDHVIMVGGSTRAPIVHARLAEFFGQAPLAHVNVEHAVAIGAAYQAAALSDAGRRRSIPQPPPLFDPARPNPQGSAPPGADPSRTLSLDGRDTRGMRSPLASRPPSAPPPLPHFDDDVTQRAAPVLVDVTPRALVVETAGAFSDVLIPRNARVPCGRTRQFTLGKDNQTIVRIRVAQGESARFAENTYLGEVILSGLRAAPRGEVVLSVSFELDEGGLLKVSARDLGTAKEAHATLQLVGISGSLDAMKARNMQTTLSARVSVAPEPHHGR